MRLGRGSGSNNEMYCELSQISGGLPESELSHRLLEGCKGDLSVTGDNIKDRKESPCTAWIDAGTEDEKAVTGYKLVSWRLAITYLGVLITCGLLKLVLYWVPRWELLLTHTKCDLAVADKVLVTDHYKADYVRYYVKPISTVGSKEGSQQHELPHRTGPNYRLVSCYRYFRCQKRVYLWDAANAEFFANHGLDEGVALGQYHNVPGLDAKRQADRRTLYGPNEIVVPQHSVLFLLMKEILNPFYVFQVASVTLWFADEYYYYAAAIVLMSAWGISTSIYQTKKNQASLRSTVHTTDTATVYRGGDVFETVSSTDLMPGDIISIPSHGCNMTVDAILIAGNAIVNEAMLTGESVPVTKTAAPAHHTDAYDSKEHARNTLFCGTRVIQTRHYPRQKVLAVVLRTGFLTAKGSLVRSILYPAPVDFKFEQDSYKFVTFLASIAFVGFAYTAINLFLEGEPLSEIALESLDLITIVVPPALPAAMTIGSMYAQKRLQKKNIYCISPRTINVSGSIDCVCFDKTGTLTEDGLDMWGVVSVDGKQSRVFDKPQRDPSNLGNDNALLHGMAVCHSLTYIDGELTGDPLDVIMFQSTGWVLEEPKQDTSQQFDTLESSLVRSGDGGENSTEFGLIRQFPFASSRQCMSAVVRAINADHFSVFVKGSPEKISALARQDTIPGDFHRVLESYTEKGYRVLAVGKRELDRGVKLPKVQRMERDDAEKDLYFLGLIVMENRIKVETTPVIKNLHSANLRTIMITGDNVNTAISVAKECGIIRRGKIILVAASPRGDSYDLRFHPSGEASNTSKPDGNFAKDVSVDVEGSYSFAVDGATLDVVRYHFPDVLDKLAVRGAVFARMRPEQKQALVERLQELGYYVAMCGDGANDCGALKAAHAGISLSDAESSVASPFTSKEPNISCVPELIREGRCALVTSFGIFKYMAAYSLTQFTSVLILYSIDSNLTDFQFLYIDLFLITTFAFFFGMTEAYEGNLAPQPPMKSLISLVPICSLLLQLIPILGFQVLAFLHVQSQPWFVPFDSDNPDFANTSAEEFYKQSTIDDTEAACWENYAVFTVSSFQYIILAYTYSKSRPYRKFIFTNYWLVGSMIALTAFTVYVVLYPAKWLQALFEIFLPPSVEFRYLMLGFALANVVICLVLEDGLVEQGVFNLIRSRSVDADKTDRRYLKVERALRQSPSWPTVTQMTQNDADEALPPATQPHSLQKVEVDVRPAKEEDFRAFAAGKSAHHSAAAQALNNSQEVNSDSRNLVQEAQPRNLPLAVTPPSYYGEKNDSR